MKKYFAILFILIVFSLAFFSCKKDGTFDMGYNYFPNQVGKYVVYDVDSMYYDNFFTPVKVIHTRFQLKEIIESVFNDNQNRPTLRLERYVKHYDSLVPYSAMQWTLRNVWVENRTATTAEKVEENVRYVRLIFPPVINKIWNANAQNTYDERDFTYQFVDQSVSVGNINFPQALETLCDDGGKILTSREYRTEKYARDVGLIYRQEIVVQSQPRSDATSAELQTFYATPIMQRITSGYQFTWTINSYGP